MGLIKTIRSRVAFNCSTMGEVAPVDYAARVIVELLPSLKAIKKDEDADAFPELISLLEKVSAANKRHSYSKEALLSLVKEEFLTGKSVWDYIELIGNSSFCFFPTEMGAPMHFTTVSQNPPLLRTDYGEEPYLPKTNPVKTRVNNNEHHNEPEDEPHTKEIRDKEPVERQNVRRTATKQDLSNLPEIVALKKKYNELEKPGEKYIWKWRVKTEDYEAFHDLLLAVDFTERTREKVRLCANQLAFYIAEWYKREYDGNNSANCLGEFQLSSAFSKEIWEHSHSEDDRPYCTPDTRINEWLYSLYIQGGFPIKYTRRAVRFAPLFDEIWGDDQKLDTISEEQLYELTQGFDGNQVVKNSLISGSLHEYYRYLRIQETMPIAETDMDKDPFAEFIRNLQEGKKKYFEHYLKPIWYLYLDPRDNIIEGVVRVSFGRKDDKCYIPFECLQYWGVSGLNSLQEFDIEVCDSASGLKRSIHFSKTGPDNFPFVGWSRDNVITLPISHEKSGNISVSIVTNTGNQRIGESFSMGDSRQFYKTKRPYEWSSKTDNCAHTAVLYNPVKLTLCDENTLRPEDCPREKFFEDGGQVWKWMTLSEKITLQTDNGETTSYSPHNNSLDISFKTRKDTIKYVNFRDVVFCQHIDDEIVQTAVPLYCDKGLTIQYTPFGSKVPQKVKLNECELYYKSTGDSRFIKWENDTNVNQGLIQIKVVYQEKGVSATKQVFYLPSPDPIRRMPDDNLIVFAHGLSDILAPTLTEYAPLDKDEEGNYVYYDNIVSGYNPQSDTIPFIIGRPDDSYIVVNVFRSCVCKELYLKTLEEPIKRYDRSRSIVEIPLALRDNFEVRSIDNKGVTRNKCGQDVYMRFDYNIRSTINSPYSIYNDYENGFRYYVVTDRRVPNGKPGQFQLETGPAEYRFYYWSMNAGEEPVLLDQSFDETTKILTVDTSYLKKNKSGIVFQSLKGVSPRHYIRPIYGERSISELRWLRVKCFDVATEHEIPYQVFPCLTDIFTRLTDSYVSLSAFWVELMRNRRWKPSTKDFRCLHRFASEFLFDWILIPKRIWKNLMLKDPENTNIKISNPECRDIMTRLFRTSPYLQKEGKEYLERILEIYWAVPSFLEWDFRKSSRLENVFLQCVRGGSKDYSCMDRDYELRLNKLKEFRSNNSLYERVYRLMIQLKK